MPNIKIETKTMQDIRRVRARQAGKRAKWVFAYLIMATVAIIWLATGFIARGREIDRLNTLKGAYEQEAANLAQELNNLQEPYDPCDLDVVFCAGEPETPVLQVHEAQTPPDAQKGTTKASWYDYRLSGQEWSKSHRTAASREFPRGTMLEVCHAEKCVEVLVNDYGPSASVHPDRGLDLSSYAFAQLAPLARGVIEVSYRKINL